MGDPLPTGRVAPPPISDLTVKEELACDNANYCSDKSNAVIFKYDAKELNNELLPLRK
ncbi:MAG: hypothetical protein L7F78_13440 [Syntrophales bacterium LBB04]|nr:hypothetical protein [Syntrophales bacterium LBB04]